MISFLIFWSASRALCGVGGRLPTSRGGGTRGEGMQMGAELHARRQLGSAQLGSYLPVTQPHLPPGPAASNPPASPHRGGTRRCSHPGGFYFSAVAPGQGSKHPVGEPCRVPAGCSPWRCFLFAFSSSSAGRARSLRQAQPSRRSCASVLSPGLFIFRGFSACLRRGVVPSSWQPGCVSHKHYSREPFPARSRLPFRNEVRIDVKRRACCSWCRDTASCSSLRMLLPSAGSICCW